MAAARGFGGDLKGLLNHGLSCLRYPGALPLPGALDPLNGQPQKAGLVWHGVPALAVILDRTGPPYFHLCLHLMQNTLTSCLERQSHGKILTWTHKQGKLLEVYFVARITKKEEYPSF